MSKTASESSENVKVINRPRRAMYGGPDDGSEPKESLLYRITKGMTPSAESATKQTKVPGEKSHPFDMAATKRLRIFNIHHGVAIATKVACTVGMGFADKPKKTKSQPAPAPAPAAGAPGAAPQPMPMDPQQVIADKIEQRNKLSKVEKALNPLCEVSLLDTLTSFANDFWELNQAYLEVVRSKGGKIVGIHYVQAETIFRVIEADGYNEHFVQHGGSLEDGQADKRFAKFGDLEETKVRLAALGQSKQEIENLSELIVWRGPCTTSRWYSIPTWVSAVPTIELAQMQIQHESDFFQNRGVPEFMLFVLGKKLDEESFKKIETSIRAGIGLGNQYKSVVANIGDPEVKVQMERLAVEGSTASGGDDRHTTYSLDIVSAHSVPPLLAGIVTPGKMAAANELPNALLGFQSLTIGPAQRSLWSLLSSAFVGEIRGLTEEDFRLRAITDEFDFQTADTTARMRTPVAQANQEGRDPAKGLKKKNA